MESLVAWLGGEDAILRSLGVGLLVAARIGPVAVLAPWLAMRATPAVVRSAVTLALTVALAPIALQSAPALPGDGATMALLAVREALVGAVFAVATALPLYALDWAGRLVDVWRGASLAEVIAPPTGERTSPLGDLYLLMGVALFATLGGHRLAIATFAEGLAVTPVGEPGLAGIGDVALGAAQLTGSALAFAVALAAPAAVTIIALESALGLVARSAPQVPVFFAGMPLRAAAGIAAVLLGLSLVVGELPDAYREAVRTAGSLLERMGG